MFGGFCGLKIKYLCPWQSFNIEGHAFCSCQRLGKHGPGFLQQWGGVGVASRIVPDEQLAYAGFAGNGGGLCGRGVEGLLGSLFVVLAKGSLVVEEAYALNVGNDGRAVDGVGAVGIRAGRLGIEHQIAVGHVLAIGGGPVGPLLDVVDGIKRNVVEVYHVTANVWQAGLFAEHVAAAGNAVLQGDGADAEALVFVDDLALCGVYGVELNGKRQSIAKGVKLQFQYGLQFGRRIDAQHAGAAQQGEGGNQANQSEAVVAVQVRNEDAAQTRKFESGFPHLQLGSLTAVYHVQVFAQRQNLGAGLVQPGGQGTPAAQYM